MQQSRILLLAMILIFPVLQSHSQEPAKVRFLPQWLPQAQFAGYYMAYEKGIYKKHGLDVEILKGGPARPLLPSLQKNQTDIASMFLSGGIKASAGGLDLVLIGQLSHSSALMFVARKSSGIAKIEDFNNRKIGIWRSDFKEVPLAMLNKHKIQYELVPITNTINLFLLGGIDVMCVMWYNEYHQILNAGIDEEDLAVFHFFDYDYNVPEDGIYCSRTFYERNPDVCQRFAEATIEGWEYAFSHKEEALDVVIRYMQAANVPANKAHQRWMLSRMQDVMVPGSKPLDGQLDEASYLRTANIILESGHIDHVPDFGNFNKTQRLK